MIVAIIVGLLTLSAFAAEEDKPKYTDATWYLDD